MFFSRATSALMVMTKPGARNRQMSENNTCEAQ